MPRCDLVIKDGIVVDCSGSPPFRADVGIVEDSIRSVGDLAGSSAEKVDDASDLIVAPGFIDIHSHFDETLLLYPSAESALLQGITTGVGDNCGFSQAPLRDWWLRSIWDEEVIQRLYP